MKNLNILNVLCTLVGGPFARISASNDWSVNKANGVLIAFSSSALPLLILYGVWVRAICWHVKQGIHCFLDNSVCCGSLIQVSLFAFRMSFWLGFTSYGLDYLCFYGSFFHSPPLMCFGSRTINSLLFCQLDFYVYIPCGGS